MRHLTIRNVPDELARALDDERRRHGRSLNRTVIDLLTRALGVGVGRTRSNGLAELGGTWSAADQQQFEAATEVLEEVDEEVWR